jgi:hypothetical protein
VSGANAVQFGLGGSAGTSESTSARANLTRNRQKLTLRADSYGSERTTFDLSQVLIPKKLALRLATLRENKEFFIRPGYEENRRAFVAGTYQPFKNTTIRVEGEYVHRRDGRPPTTMARDNGYLHWLASQRAGNPQTYLNRAADAATAGRPAVPTFTHFLFALTILYTVGRERFVNAQMSATLNPFFMRRRSTMREGCIFTQRFK